MINRYIFGSGVVWGLEVEPVIENGGSPAKIKVGKGLAIDAHWREILVDREVLRDLTMQGDITEFEVVLNTTINQPRSQISPLPPMDRRNR